MYVKILPNLYFQLFYTRCISLNNTTFFVYFKTENELLHFYLLFKDSGVNIILKIISLLRNDVPNDFIIKIICNAINDFQLK